MQFEFRQTGRVQKVLKIQKSVKLVKTAVLASFTCVLKGEILS